MVPFAAHSQQEAELMRHNLLAATDDEPGTYTFRVLRLSETPESMREPPAAYSQMGRPDAAPEDKAELRRHVIRAIATGNRTTSPFLHGTALLSKAKRIYLERNHLYKPVLVRWGRDAVDPDAVLNFSDVGTGLQIGQNSRGMLSDLPGDTQETERHLNDCRAWVTKDREIVYLRRPGSSWVEYWDLVKLRWRPSSEFQEAVDIRTCCM